MNYGTLYGVGVGPGAPDLLTVRAIQTLKGARVLALPRSSDYGQSMAWKIIQPVIGEVPDQERLFLTFPMSKDPDRLIPAWNKAFLAIGSRLEQGLTVAFATEGDPSLYSTFIYLQMEAQARWPGIRVEVVPGVSSIAAVPAVTGIPLADGQERIAILPATYGISDLSRILEEFDTVILMKIGREMPFVIAELEQAGLVDKAVYVSRATMPDQRIVRDIRSSSTEYGDCFAMAIVSKKSRSRAIAGDRSAQIQEAIG
ncbi:MAG TPA: precorrin-2 C(20)-methyltransferase [Candidatus Angelobacter sp.]|nr:precorrin-2 C(20)-methyltransferase [Candidatus Angelobacter sp.]